MTSPADYGQSPAEPAAPRGPGVVPPFVAPPTDRDNKRVWIGVGVGVLVVALCCVAGVVGIGVLVAGSAKQVEVQARQAVDDYLGALVKREYPVAYERLCQRIKDDESRQTFTRRAKDDPVASYTVGAVKIGQTEITVDAAVEYSQRGRRDRVFVVEAEVGRMTVCGER